MTGEIKNIMKQNKRIVSIAEYNSNMEKIIEKYKKKGIRVQFEKMIEYASQVEIKEEK